MTMHNFFQEKKGRQFTIGYFTKYAIIISLCKHMESHRKCPLSTSYPK